MPRTIPIWVLLMCSVVIVAEAKPIFVKIFAPIGGYSSGTVRSTATVAPVNNQLISNLISQKIQLLNSFLQAKSSFGSFGIRKDITFTSGSTTTTERPVTLLTTEVNTDFLPDVSSSTQSVYTTTTEGEIATPKPTVHPVKPITSSTPVIPTKSTTEYIVESSSGSIDDYTSQTTPRTPAPTPTSNGYSYQTPTSSSISTTANAYYLPALQ
ncbi:mucin-2 isoform X1 [Drosophila hydei]|uniref:Mucin-2 isoform X1 n=1 Tax=Drosophila hydei TaxID=7224 RepID=A0A6J1LQW0_DROHY|nr:mucin-2 isoform X1 [Drosophila hydei]XP_023170077.2 mucin-2 isoform X1 [Drosophila hydei]